LAKTAHLTDALYIVRQQIAKYAGADSGRIGISLTETNVDIGRNTQPGALFLADTYATLLANGVFTVQWWNVHNGMGNVSTVAGQTDYGDFGILSSGSCNSDGTTCEPSLNTPFAPYHGLSLMNKLARPGDQFIRAATDDPLVTAHAVRRSNGDVNVLLLNRDPDNARDVTIDYAGFAAAAGAVTVHTYANGAAGIATTQAGTATSQALPPYSLTVVQARNARAVSGLPTAPGQPAASAVTDRTVTLSWPAGGAGAHPIAKYEVHRQLGAVSEQLGETPGTSLTVNNLRPGSRYTVNVLARDTAGNVSWASPPLTFTTGTPAQSTCTVKWTYAADWSSGYVASVDITNTGTRALTSWTLTYEWPTTWQQMNGGWNATWTETGRTVKVTNLDSNGALAAEGGTVNVGFVGGYSGPNVTPAVFTLNGNVCTTLP
jgi:hypothetical protein